MRGCNGARGDKGYIVAESAGVGARRGGGGGPADRTRAHRVWRRPAKYDVYIWYNMVYDIVIIHYYIVIYYIIQSVREEIRRARKI